MHFLGREMQLGSLGGSLCQRERLPHCSGQDGICVQPAALSGIWLILGLSCLSAPSQGARINLATLGLLLKSAWCKQGTGSETVEYEPY